MRIFVVLVVLAVLGWFFLVPEAAANLKKPQPRQMLRPQTASPRPVSEHNWVKHSLDKTNEVKRQVAEQRKADGSEIERARGFRGIAAISRLLSPPASGEWPP